MLPVVYLLDRKKEKRQELEKQSNNKKMTITGSLVCGCIMALLSVTQQYGLQYTSCGKAGFITALYILFTPLVGLFIGKRVSKRIWTAVGIALIGMYLMCMGKGDSGINLGDMLMLLAAIICTAHVYFIDYYVQTVNPVKLSSYQFIVAGLLCIVPTVFIETDTFTLENIRLCLVPLLYAGLVSGAVGYTFQMIGQKYTEPSKASLLLSSETVFSLLAGLVILHEVLQVREYIGCAIMLAAILIAQAPPKEERDLITASHYDRENSVEQ